MAQENLRFKVTADTKQFVQGMKQVQNETTKANANTRRQGQAFTQLAYALDDVQYGFRGIQNNLQAIAVTAGASGPVVLGITALTVGIGYLLSNSESLIGVDIEGWFKKHVLGATAAKDAMEKLNEVVKTFDESMRESTTKSIVEIQELEAALKILTKIPTDLQVGGDAITEGGGGAFAGAFDLLNKEGIDATKLSYEELVNAVQKLIAKKRAERDLDIERSTYTEKLNQLLIVQKDATERFTDAQRELNEELNKPKYKQNANLIRGLRKQISDITNEIKTNQGALSDLEDHYKRVFTNLLGIIGGEGPDSVESKLINVSENLQRSLSSAFSGIGKAIGESFASGFDGDSMLKLLGSFMTAFGSALIASGVAALALKELFANPWAAIAAGTALVAAGAAISSSAKKNPVAGARSSGNNAAFRPSAIATTSIQGSGSTSGFIAIRGQDLRYINQAAADSYSGLN